MVAHVGSPGKGSPAVQRRRGRVFFLVISDPRLEPPGSVTAARQHFWTWVAPLQASGEVRSIYAKVGRGAMALFDVASNEALHRRLNEWADIIPARFDAHALIDPDAAQRYLNGA
jgi:hypothetical protein